MLRDSRALTALAGIYVVIVLAVALAPHRALGHDEAVYAIGARGLVEGAAADEFPLHRSIGMRALALPGYVLGGGERAMRLPFALIALGYLAAVYAIGRRRFGAPAGALAVALIATTSLWQWRSAEALSDVPSALCLLGAVGLCAGTTRSWRHALAAGACAAAACYLRYASFPVVAAIFAIAFLGDPPRRRWIAGAAAIGAALVVPFFAWSAARTGSVLGVLEIGERMGQPAAYPGAGLVFYLRAWPVLLAGPVTGAAAALGVVVGLAAWRGNGDAPGVRARRLLAGAAVAQIVVLGWRMHGETRFILFAVTALAIAGASWLAERPGRWRAALIAVALTAIPSAAWTVVRLDRLAASRVPLVEAAAAIRADARDGDCLVFTTEAPMTTWYTRCRAIAVDGWGLDPARATGASRIYLVEASGLRSSLAGVEPATRGALGWLPQACTEPRRWCVWRATRRAR